MSEDRGRIISGAAMHVASLWRYPVKSMGGEQLEAGDVEADGLHGDRWIQVVDPAGRVLTSRAHPKLLLMRASLDASDNVVVDGRKWPDPQLDQAASAAAGRPVRLLENRDLERFDVMPLLVATDGAIKALQRDGRRLRPNIVIGGVEGLAERSWPGRRLQIGSVILGIESLRQRCVMTTYDPDTAVQDLEVLRDIVHRFDGRLALDCFVERPGRIAVGDAVALM